jgi:hypothetical protein
MDTQLIIICVLTFVIHLIGTLAYAARIAGVRTRRIAVSFSLFNILILVSRTSNSFQGPFLAKRIENTIAGGVSHGLLTDFRWMLWSATLATVAGALLTPMFQRIFSRAVIHFQANRSVPRLLLHIFFSGIPWVHAATSNTSSLPFGPLINPSRAKAHKSRWSLYFSRLAHPSDTASS